ncbi:MAG: hypothetical protein QOK15_3323 [Nocardioidaceae bacterium]|nr:hypothetical protein [Nocardioidaceae bacterium]
MVFASRHPGDRVEHALGAALAEATGREVRANPVLPRTGGPAGNTLLTAWTALVLLVLSIAELLTLFDVRGLISWHVALGALLLPPSVMKTASTGWRMTRYYLGNPPYRQAGPPPLLLRLLGPLVVISTLGLLGTGVLLVLIGQQQAHTSLVALLGVRIDWVTLHQGFFAVWAGAAGLHLLGRVVPALRATVLSGTPAAIPGRGRRALWFGVMGVSAAVLAVVLVQGDSSWSSHGFEPGSFVRR